MPVTETSTDLPRKRFKSDENVQTDKTEQKNILKSSSRNISQVSLPSTSYFEKTANIFSSTKQDVDCYPEKSTR